MTYIPRLHKRPENGIYYCRAAVPENLVPIVGKREIKVSLKTTSRHQAHRLLVLASYQINQTFAAARGQAMEMPLPTTTLSKAQGITINELVERYFAAQEHQRLTPSTRMDYNVRFNVIKAIMGESKPITEITRNDCRNVQQLVMKLPPNATKRFPNQTISQVIAHAEKHDLPRLAPKTVNLHITCLSILMEWACKEQLLSANPARGLLVQDTVAMQDKRAPFTMEQLQTLFTSPAMQKAKAANDSKFWIPMLALWTGARLGEICQLAMSDVQTVEGIPVLVIREGEGKRLKTINANRTIPLHPKLLEMGFMDFAERRRQRGCDSLFISSAKDFSKWFTRYQWGLKIKSEKTCFHSFRHNFRDALRVAQVDREMVQALGGWKNSAAGTEDIYGSGVGILPLQAAIRKIQYQGLEDVF